MSCGTPVIGTYVGTIMEPVIPVTLLISRYEDEIADVLFLNRDKKRWSRLSELCRIRALRFDWSIIVEKLEKIYLSI